MELGNFGAIFLTIFLAEMGDKTQLAALLFATNNQGTPLGVFLAASAALITATAIAVVGGGLVQAYLSHIPLKLIAGIGFVAVGLWSIAGHFIGNA